MSSARRGRLTSMRESTSISVRVGRNPAMRRRTLLAGAAAVGVSALTAGVGPGSPASAGVSGSWRAGLAGLHEAMAARVARRELAGIVYAVAHRGRLHVDTIGTLLLDGKQPMRRGTPFRMASLTKPIIAAA